MRISIGKLVIHLMIIIIILIVSLWLINKYEEPFTINGINSFDKIMYINLSHREDRKKQILNELNKLETEQDKIIRIDAIYNKFNGHIGCAKSHIKAIELAKKMNLKNVVILEDDFILTINKKQFDNKINYFLTHFKDNWDVIQFTSVWKKLNDIDNIDHVKKVSSASTSSGYIIQSHFYDQLLSTLKESVTKMKEEMKIWKEENKNKKKTNTQYALDQYWSKLQKKSNWYIFYPYLGKQGGTAGKSSIMGKLGSEHFKINHTIKLAIIHI